MEFVFLSIYISVHLSSFFPSAHVLALTHAHAQLKCGVAQLLPFGLLIYGYFLIEDEMFLLVL